MRNAAISKSSWAAAWQYYKNCIFTAEAKRCPAEDLLQQYYTTHDRNISEDCLLYGSSFFFFFFWITLQHAFHGRTHVYTESKTAELQPYVPKACIAKPLGSQSCVKHNKQWANSSLSPRLNFFISAFKCITRGSKWCPVFQVASPSIHWGCNQETSENCQPGSRSCLGLLCKNTWSYWQLTPNEKLPSFPICIKSTTQDTKLINSWSLTQQSFYFSDRSRL